MDRNLSNEPGYRPKGDYPAPQMPAGEPDYYGVGARQVLARMPNLTAVDPDVDPIQSYPPQPENRVISSGVSVKLLAGGAVCLALVAAVGFSFFNRKPSGETPNVPTGWQAPAPAPGAEQAPRFEMASSAPSWPSPAPANASANPWGGASSTPWNGTANSPATSPAGSTIPSTPAPANAWSAPTELTASATNLPVWGQVQEPNAPAPSNANASNSSATPWTPPPSMTMPAVTPPAWANPTPINNAPTNATAAPGPTGTVASYNGAYQPAPAAPAYAAPYSQPASGASAANGNLPGGSLNGTASAWGGGAANAPVTSDPRTPNWSDANGAVRTNATMPYDARGSFNSGATGQTPYSSAPYTQPALQPSASVAGNSYSTADTRAMVGGSYGASPPSAANYGNPSGSYPTGAVASRSNYPNASSLPTQMPGQMPAQMPAQVPAAAGSVPSNNYPTNYPAGNYPTNATPANYPANSYGNPSSAFPATSTGSYPGMSAPVGAPPAPRYDSGASSAAPQTGAPEGYLR